jgi:hypothetical protein
MGVVAMPRAETAPQVNEREQRLASVTQPIHDKDVRHIQLVRTVAVAELRHRRSQGPEHDECSYSEGGSMKLNIKQLLVCTILLVALNTVSAAQDWVASTGSLDTGSLGTARFVGGAVYVRPDIANGKVTIRFNVVPVRDLTIPINLCGTCSRALRIRYIDNGNAAQVLARLRRYNLETGVVSTLLQFDSNLFLGSASFQRRDSSSQNFDFFFADRGAPVGGEATENSVYFIEVDLIRSGSGGNPALAGLAILTEIP